MKKLCIIAFCCLLFGGAAFGDDLPQATKSFIGIDGQSMTDLGNIIEGYFDFINNIKDSGILLYGDEKVLWRALEPEPPIDGIHTYNWQPYDEVVRKAENSGGDILPTIWSVSPWGSGRPIKPSAKPLPEHEDDYKSFIREFVERYDGDGYKDMGYETPADTSDDLKFAHNYIQIEDEAANIGDSFEAINTCGEREYNPSYFICAADAYGGMLRLAHEAAHEANPNAKVISFSFNAGVFFDRNPIVTQERWDNWKINHPHAAFLERVFSNFHMYIDNIGIQGNYSYIGFASLIELFNVIQNENGISKPIMIADAASIPIINTSLPDRYYDQYPYLTNLDIFGMLMEGSSVTNNTYNRNNELVTYPELRQWWEVQKAATMVKKALVAAWLNVETISFQFMMAPGNSLNPWTHSGLLSSGLASEDDGESGTPRIGVYAVQQLTSRIMDFQLCENAHHMPPGTNPQGWFWVIKCTDQLYVLWNETPDNADLSALLPDSSSVTLTPMVTEFVDGDFGGYVPDYPDPVIYPIESVPVSDIPAFIEPN